MLKRYDVLMCLFLIGEIGVGKICVLCCYVSEEFIDLYIMIIGKCYFLKFYLF